MGQTHQQPSNKGRLIGQKPPLKLKDIWTDDALEISEQTEI